MIRLQEATGNYRLSVGHYQRAWDGLGISVSQVVRELPAAAVSLNTFFLGISNNIPMLVDEINRLREQNKLLQAEGKETINVTRRLISALFSWNTVLVILLTVFSAFGEEIINFVSGLFRARDAVMSTSEAMSNISKELENNNNNYGQNIVSLKRLQQEWKNLKTTAEKNQWIKDNESEFRKLDISINNVNDADNAFINNTEAIINALKLRARATAATSLAEQEYEKELIARNKAEVERLKQPSATQQLIGALVLDPAYEAGSLAGEKGVSRGEIIRQSRIASLEKEADAAKAAGDAYFEYAASYEKAAKEILNAADIEESHRKTRQGREPRDLTNIINRNDITVQRRYEESVTELLRDEYAKRRKEAADQVQDENNKLREMYRLNETYIANVDGKYKQLTEDQKKQIDKQQKLITETIANNLKALDLQLQQIMNEQKINSLQIQRNTINPTDISGATQAVQNQESTVTTNAIVTRNASQIEASLIEERRLMEENLDIEYALILDTNRRLLEAGDDQARSEEEILIELNKKKLQLWSEYDQQILEARQRDIEAQLEIVQKGSEDELQLLIQQNEIARQIALAQNAAKPASEQVSTSVINAQFDKAGNLATGQFEMTNFEQQQALDEAIFNEIERNEREITRFKLEQERDRWEKQIALAESGGLDWSQAQIDAAKATVVGIEHQLIDLDDIIKNIGKKGTGVTLLEAMGFSDDQIYALQDATNIVIENLQSILDAEIELAEQAVAAAEERVEAAQKAYDAEVEARNNGYANNVATAKKELEQEKKNQLARQKQLDAAQKRQESLNTITQASSLVTASANLWSAFSSIPIVGPALAMAAIATMWTSFAAAKVKARQVTATASEEYGEGGLEFLEGGSHASGNDIDLGVKNSKKKRMKAEGGEALAIINKRNTRRYKKLLPDVIDSFNKGTFEDKYMNAFAGSDKLNIELNSNSSNIDLSKIENDVQHIRRQNETKYYTLPDGTVIMQRKNVRRIIKN